MSPTRGDTPIGTLGPNPWGYDEETGWEGRLVPDRIIKTYEGYGTEPSAIPAEDPYLLQSGTWIIDEASYNDQGDIELRCRDIGRLLLDQIAFPPVIPYEEYPIAWSKIRTETFKGRDAKGGSFVDLTQKNADATSSNKAYVGEGMGAGYVGQNGGVNGHHPNHVLENRDGAYWQSTGQSSTWSVVWWQATMNNARPINAIRFTPQGGPYRVYISLKGPNGWIGRRKVPYDVTTGGVDVEAGIPFVWSDIAERNKPLDAILKRVYGGITEVRLTFTKLNDSGQGQYPFNAGLRDIKVYTAAQKSDLSFGIGNKLKSVGNYSDYTDVVKWACAWGGFFWPPHGTDLDFIKYGGDRHYLTYASPDLVLPRGRVWGDFMNSGTSGQAPGGDLSADLFDKQPLMTLINYVRDILGFIFFIDETGGVVWRMPNWEKVGNYVSPTHLGVRSRSRTNQVITIDDENTLISYSTTYNGRSQRERIFVADTDGNRKGVAIKGFTAYPVNFRRIAGWTDQHFETKQETRVMADMIAARQMFDYRRSRVTIAGNPAIQIDDQVRIYERVTNETLFHYVETISCNLDMDTGQYTYDLETHWLGEDPTDSWVVKREILDAATRNYLDTIGGGEVN
jgi:hypothetical protein